MGKLRGDAPQTPPAHSPVPLLHRISGLQVAPKGAPSSSASQLQLNALQQPLSILSVTKVIIPSPAYRTTPRQCGLVSTSADFNLQPAT
ncbi:unnamed protein product [Rangifer tarandus platyrhynchus]|uniref:Uncharacterized protein n=2 Tax=Rangifer tarandus platyrhynchus TaxID=3082113 RepID=A0ABN8Z402_RANTA|nr:unnamed protein product [Rangifer tarandus platyrhynchus]CAI9704906.1 unnamed protein product [Rangifer tarandus platyrhynchus]